MSRHDPSSGSSAYISVCEGHILDGAITVVGVGLLTFLSIVMTHGACTGDGSYDPLGPAAHLTEYCRATQAYGWPHSWHAIGLMLVLFLGPFLLAALSVVPSSDRARRLLRRAAIVAALVPFGLFPLAGSSFSGIG